MLLSFFQAALWVATALCFVVAGFLFAFAVVVMPGIRTLDDAGFLRSFQVIDRVIQNRQPLFLVVWVGSVLAAIAAAVLGVWALTGADRVLLVVAAVVYLLGVQLPTAKVNVPLNDQLQGLALETMTEATRRRARDAFEPRWNRWNVFRTVCASAASALLLLLLLRV
jgi:uncharacterized membrane protein